MIQKELFDDLVITGESIEDKIVYKPIKTSKATFKSGTNKTIHQWFRLTPSFGPDLVDIMLEDLNHRKGNIVLDPFSGASTTIIQCKLRGIESFGFEINPMLHFVGKTCTNWDLEARKLNEILSAIIEKFKTNKIKFKDKKTEELGYRIPTIFNIHRWWRDDVLKDLLILKNIIKELKEDNSYIDFFMLGLSAVLVPDLTNVTLGRLQLHFIDRSNDEINVIKTFNEHLIKVISDIDILNEVKEYPKCELYHTDATELAANIKHKADLVITSPPYPNRYSYVWNTRPHLYFLDIFEGAKEASALDKKTIGGTWGVATSCLAKGIIEPIYPEISNAVLPTVDLIREKDNLMANYVMKYFNLMAKQIVEMEKVVSKDVKVAYVVGNSSIKGVYVATDIILANIFESLNLGYKTDKIMRFRKRNSGVNLYETIIYASKSA